MASLRDAPHLSDIFLKYKLFWSILILFEIIKEDFFNVHKSIGRPTETLAFMVLSKDTSNNFIASPKSKLLS